MRPKKIYFQVEGEGRDMPVHIFFKFTKKKKKKNTEQRTRELKVMSVILISLQPTDNKGLRNPGWGCLNARHCASFQTEETEFLGQCSQPNIS